MSFSKVDRQTGDLTTVAGTPSDAIQVAYDNASSGLSASNVQSAIDEVAPKGYNSYQIYQAAGPGWKKISGFKTITAYDSAGFRLQVRSGGLAEINLSSGDSNVQEIKVWLLNPAPKLEAIKFDGTSGELYVRIGQYTRLDLTQFSGKRLNLTVTDASETTGNDVEIESVPLSQLPTFDHMDIVRNSNWAKMGEKYNWDPGFLRQGRIPRKVVVIGNSITYHGRASYWEVDDLREMAASTPTSGWVSLVYRELKKINPNIQMYKANGATWETATLGSRAYSDLSSNTVAKMTDTGCEVTSLTINDVLTSDVDIVICQLYENIGDPGTDGITNLITDYQNLYDTFREKCPKAFLYQFAGFWQSWNKHQAVVRACYWNNVECIYAFTLNPLNTGYSSNMSSNSHGLYEAQTGDKIYDNSGTEITTVTSTVAGHPNDAGFATIAAHVICRLYNAYFTGTADKQTQQFKLDLWGGTPYTTQLDEIETVCELFFGGAASATASDPTTTDDMFNVSHGLYGSVFDFLVFFSGITATALTYGTAANHSYIKTLVAIDVSAYTRFKQTICDVNASYTFERCVNLSASATVPTPWVPVRSTYPYIDGMVSYTGEYYGGRLVKRLCIIPSSSVAPNPTNWSTITDVVSSARFDAHPTEILKITSGNGIAVDTHVQNVFIENGLRFRFDDATSVNLFVAANSEFTWEANRALWVDYI